MSEKFGYQMRPCIDCGMLRYCYRQSLSGRCRSCKTKYQLRVKGHPNYRHGKTMIKNNCSICQLQIKDYKARFCMSCFAKRRFIDSTKHPSYKDGRTINGAMCVDCGDRLKHYLSKRCISCKHLAHRKNRPKSHCIDCGLQLRRYHSKRCTPCRNKSNGLLRRGVNHPSWIDGRSFKKYPPEFTDQLKEKIKKRDYYTCQLCQMTQPEHFSIYGRDLHVHHIDYNKVNCSENNLITLCQGCNIRVNANRDYWTGYFKIMVQFNLMQLNAHRSLAN